MSRLPFAIGALLVCSLLASCAGTAKTKYPLLPAPGKAESALDCAGLADRIEKADAIRWSIRESGVKMPATSANDALVAVSWIAIAASAFGGPPLVPVGNPEKAPVYALARADARIEKLLVLRRDQSCPANPTAVAGVSDMDALAQLERLQK